MSARDEVLAASREEPSVPAVAFADAWARQYAAPVSPIDRRDEIACAYEAGYRACVRDNG